MSSISSSRVMQRAAAARPRVWVPLLLALGTAAVYAPVHRYAFVNFDDLEYVADNPHVNRGLTPDGVAWAFTAWDVANWHPLTWLSHMADVQAFGLDAGAHHLVSVAIHVANTLLVLRLLAGMSGQLWPSAFVAALFALHPLHVESVAWVAERKDVLSTFFGLLAIWCWWRYTQRPGPGRYLLAIVVFAAALMAKPMLVTLPFVLLLLDRWPLRRRVSHSRMLAEQVPFLLLAAGTSVVTFMAQRAGGAVTSLATTPLDLRVANALNSYVVYLVKMVWPTRLAVFYPYPAGYPAWWVATCAVALTTVSLAVLRLGSRRPYLLVGWLWYVGTLVPVIGLVRAGDQAMADRFTYLPSIGIFLMVAWAGADLYVARPRGGPLLTAAASFALVGCATLTSLQLTHWRDSMTLFQHALAVAPESHLPHTNLGTALIEQGRVEDALPHLRAALRLAPGLARTHVNLGMALAARGETDAAVDEYRDALALDPASAMAHYNLGHVFAAEERLDDAAREYGEAVRLDPAYAKAHNNLGLTLARQGRFEEAITHYREAMRLRPELAAAHGNLAVALETVGSRDEAVAQYAETVRLLPDDPRARFNFGAALVDAGRTDDALAQVRALGALAAGAARAARTRAAVEIARQAANLARAAGREDLARELVDRGDRYAAAGATGPAARGGTPP